MQLQDILLQTNNKRIDFRVVTIIHLHIRLHHTAVLLIIFLKQHTPKYFIPYISIITLVSFMMDKKWLFITVTAVNLHRILKSTEIFVDLTHWVSFWSVPYLTKIFYSHFNLPAKRLMTSEWAGKGKHTNEGFTNNACFLSANSRGRQWQSKNTN